MQNSQNQPQNCGFSQENGDVLDELEAGDEEGWDEWDEGAEEHGDVCAVDVDDVFGFKQGIVTKPIVETQAPPSVR